jgi:hypothetical protein
MGVTCKLIYIYLHFKRFIISFFGDMKCRYFLKLQVFEDNLSLLSDNEIGVEEATTNHNDEAADGDQEEEHFVRCPPNSLENNQSDVEEQQLPSQSHTCPSDCARNGKVITGRHLVHLLFA